MLSGLNREKLTREVMPLEYYKKVLKRTASMPIHFVLRATMPRYFRDSRSKGRAPPRPADDLVWILWKQVLASNIYVARKMVVDGSKAVLKAKLGQQTCPCFRAFAGIGAFEILWWWKPWLPHEAEHLSHMCWQCGDADVSNQIAAKHMITRGEALDPSLDRSSRKLPFNPMHFLVHLIPSSFGIRSVENRLPSASG